MNVSILFASLHDMVCKSLPRQLGDRSLLSPGHHCCLGQSSERGQGGRRERRLAGNQHSARPSNLYFPCPRRLQWAIWMGQSRLLIWTGTAAGFFSRSSCLLWLPLLDRCWRHVTALLLLLAICPTVMGWNSLGMPDIPSTFCIIFSFLLRSKHVYHHVLHLGLKRLCITMGHCIPCKNHGTLYSYHMYACLFFPPTTCFCFLSF